MRKCVDKAEIAAKYCYLIKARGRGRPPLEQFGKWDTLATRALVGNALAIGHDALPIFR